MSVTPSSNPLPAIQFEKLLESDRTVLGDRFTYPKTASPLVTFWKVTMPPGSVGAWHEHLVPELFVVNEGTLYVVNEVRGEAKVSQFAQGKAGLTDLNVRQFIWNPTDTPVVVIAVYLGNDDTPPTRALGGFPDATLIEELTRQIRP